MPTLVPLSRMVDLAVGDPEVGAVNFNVLHSLLHAIITELNIQDVKADVNEYDREFLQTSPATSRSWHKKEGEEECSPKDGEEESRAKGKEKETEKKETEKKETEKKETEKKETEKKEKTKPPLMSKKPSIYHALEKRVDALSNKLDILNALPSTQELIVRSQKRELAIKPLADMWQLMVVKKKMAALEEGIEKLMSTTEDVLKVVARVQEDVGSFEDRLRDVEGRGESDLGEKMSLLEDLERRLKKLEEGCDHLQKRFEDNSVNTLEQSVDLVRWPQLEDAFHGDVVEVEDRGSAEKRESSKRRESTKRPDSTKRRDSNERPDSAEKPVHPAMRDSSHASLRGPSPEMLDILEKLGSFTEEVDGFMTRINSLEVEVQQKMDKQEMEGLTLAQDFLHDISILKRDFYEMQESGRKSNDVFSKLQETVLEIETELEKFSGTILVIQEEGVNQDSKIGELFQLCDSLEKKKADKEYVDMEVIVKADKEQLEGKVNSSLFDSATEEINKMIKNLLDKLADNHGEWKDMLGRLANDVDGKLDRMELTPLKDWLEKKLRSLMKKLQQGRLEWNEDAAAGLRRQLIQHYHCLSCDKAVDLMPGPAPVFPIGYPMPPSRSPRPYTGYELDQLRQHSRSYATTDIIDLYATTRQCGGAHTLTFPHKRISKATNVSHLFREDGTDIFSYYQKEKDVMGADGQIYKGRTAPSSQLVEAKVSSSTQLPAVQMSQDHRAGRPVSALAQSGNNSTPLVYPPSRQQPRPQSAQLLTRTSPQSQQGAESPQPNNQSANNDETCSVEKKRYGK